MRKLSQLAQQERDLIEAVLQELQTYEQNTYKEQIAIIKEYGLSLVDSDVLALLNPKKQQIAIQTLPKQEDNKLETSQKIYGENWIVLQNRLLHAISKLSVNERRLIILLSPLVRLARSKDPNQRLFFVQATEFSKEFGISPKTVYRTLAEVAKSIQHKPFFYWEFRENHLNERGVAWFSECEYMKAQGGIEVKLDDTVIEMLTVFDKNNQFTKYQKEYIAKLGGYGIVLFELIASCMYQKHKQKSYTVEFLRQKFDCVANYPNFFNFKRYVVDIAIKDVEKHTPYRISYTQKKRGRIVTELVFTFEDITDKVIKDKKEAIPSIPSWQTKGLSDGQINKIGVNKQEFIDANTSKISPTDRRGYDEIFDDWKQQLKDPRTVNQFNKVQELLDRQRPS